MLKFVILTCLLATVFAIPVDVHRDQDARGVTLSSSASIQSDSTKPKGNIQSTLHTETVTADGKTNVRHVERTIRGTPTTETKPKEAIFVTPAPTNVPTTKSSGIPAEALKKLVGKRDIHGPVTSEHSHSSTEVKKDETVKSAPKPEDKDEKTEALKRLVGKRDIHGPVTSEHSHSSTEEKKDETVKSAPKPEDKDEKTEALKRLVGKRDIHGQANSHPSTEEKKDDTVKSAPKPEDKDEKTEALKKLVGKRDIHGQVTSEHSHPSTEVKKDEAVKSAPKPEDKDEKTEALRKLVGKRDIPVPVTPQHSHSSTEVKKDEAVKSAPKPDENKENKHVKREANEKHDEPPKEAHVPGGQVKQATPAAVKPIPTQLDSHVRDSRSNQEHNHNEHGHDGHKHDDHHDNHGEKHGAVHSAVGPSVHEVGPHADKPKDSTHHKRETPTSTRRPGSVPDNRGSLESHEESHPPSFIFPVPVDKIVKQPAVPLHSSADSQQTAKVEASPVSAEKSSNDHKA